jgi:hypothetical protein
MEMRMENYRQAAYALLRVTPGPIFPTTDVVKFVFGVGSFAGGLQQRFADKVPMFVVTPFAYVLAFIARLRKKSACRR